MANKDFKISDNISIARVNSITYDSSTAKAVFQVYLEVCVSGVIVRAGLAASSASVFDPSQEALTYENAQYPKVSSKSVGLQVPQYTVTYTWTKGNVLPGDIWYVRPYVYWKDSNNVEHIHYGELVKYTAE